MKIIDNIPSLPKGIIVLKVFNAETNELIQTYADTNVIVLDARTSVVHSISSPISDYTISKLKLGDDVGTGTVDNPQAASNTYDENTMSIVFDAPYTLAVGYPDSISVNFGTTIIGQDVLDLYPAETSKIFTSAALHTGNGKVFSYKRFPRISISALVNIQISWTLSY